MDFLSILGIPALDFSFSMGAECVVSKDIANHYFQLVLTSVGPCLLIVRANA